MNLSVNHSSKMPCCVYIRADSSYSLGSGHIMRCLTLAEMLRDRGARVVFLCRDLNGNLCHLIRKKTFEVVVLPANARGNLSVETVLDWEEDAKAAISILQQETQDINCLVVDHYLLDEKWEKTLQTYAKKIMVIDDLANRIHACDILLDQNHYSEKRYERLVPPSCRKFLGTRHVLLRPEFINARSRSGLRKGPLRNILVAFGSSDATGETLKALQALREFNKSDLAADIVVGHSNQHNYQIKELCQQLAFLRLHYHTDYMAELMLKADLAIGAGGISAWERCYLGLPSICIVAAENQWLTTKTMEARGAAWNLGWHSSVTPYKISQAIKKVMEEPGVLLAMSKAAMQLVNGSIDQNELLDYILE